METPAGRWLRGGSRVRLCFGASAVLTESQHGCHGCFSFTHCHSSQSDGLEGLAALEEREHGGRGGMWLMGVCRAANPQPLDDVLQVELTAGASRQVMLIDSHDSYVKSY